jgi:hypothetical protein
MAFGLVSLRITQRLPARPPKTGFRVLEKLSRTGFYPQASDKRFSTHFTCAGLLFQASWHNPRVGPVSTPSFPNREPREHTPRRQAKSLLFRSPRAGTGA